MPGTGHCGHFAGAEIDTTRQMPRGVHDQRVPADAFGEIVRRHGQTKARKGSVVPFAGAFPLAYAVGRRRGPTVVDDGSGLAGIRRVAVVGCGGAGKSTFSRRLGELLDLPVTHLDRHYWRPGWVETPHEDFRATQQKLVRAECWVMDGNYTSTMDVRLPAADLIVFLDFPRWRCLFRVTRRIARGWGRDGQAPGCPEHLDWAFLRWLWDWPRDTRPRVLYRLDEHGPSARRVVLSTPREVRDFLGRLRTGDRSRRE